MIRETLSDICEMSGMAHSPAIVSRCGGPSAEELNICGICGVYIAKIRDRWISITEEQADAIRKPR
jgi:hypothetical protein